ncbi:MAG: tetratricopeptide repeat protein [Sphingomonas sp.]|jgi:cytochrome c-type biogenesis protein CcmH|uniref:tetratricopeptide repeat protein n=1 Tax=Sphingomonas sp. TaxID=28214 RepID=UPI00356ADBCC
MAATSRYGIAALAGAGVLLAGAIGWKLTSHGDVAPVPTAAATAVADPLDELRTAVRQNPNSADAWMALGDAQTATNDFADAAASFRHATTLAPTRAEPWSALGEALVKADPRDPFPAAALDAFKKAVAIDPKDPRARYFLGVRHDLDGDHKGAIDAWFAILKDSPPGAPWAADVRRTIEQVGRINKIDVAKRLAALPRLDAHAMPGTTAGSAIPGPTAAQMQAAQSLTPAQQQAMIAGMVDQLEARLAQDKTNVDGWVMLMRSRVQLHEADKARAALRAALAANPGAAQRLTAEAATLGIPAS